MSSTLPRATRGRSRVDSMRVAVIAPMLLLDSDNHRIGSRQMLDVSFLEANVAHPRAAVRARIVETARGLNKHVEAHQQTEGVLPSLVIDDRLVDDESATFG